MVASTSLRAERKGGHNDANAEEVAPRNARFLDMLDDAFNGGLHERFYDAVAALLGKMFVHYSRLRGARCATAFPQPPWLEMES